MAPEGLRQGDRAPERALPGHGRHVRPQRPAAASRLVPGADRANLPGKPQRGDSPGAPVQSPGAADVSGGFQEVESEHGQVICTHVRVVRPPMCWRTTAKLKNPANSFRNRSDWAWRANGELISHIRSCNSFDFWNLRLDAEGGQPVEASPNLSQLRRSRGLGFAAIPNGALTTVT